MGRPWSYEAPEGISSEIGGGDKKLLGGERKFCGGVKDNRLHGERISRLATAPFFSTLFLYCGITASPAKLTQRFPVMTPLPHPKKTHDHTRLSPPLPQNRITQGRHASRMEATRQAHYRKHTRRKRGASKVRQTRKRYRSDKESRLLETQQGEREA